MDATEDRSSSLAGVKVALTGRFASMSQAELSELIRSSGGECVAEVNRSTRLLVIGQDGWPLRSDGQPTRNLVKARQLRAVGYAIEFCTEEEFLERVGGGESPSAIRRRYTVNQLSRLLKVPGQRIRSWARAGLIDPVETIHRLAYFDFRQVASARTLCDLTGSGVSPQRIRDSLEQMRSWLPGVDRPLAQLSALESDGCLMVRLPSGKLAEANGQLRLDLDQDSADEPPEVLAIHARSADEWFEDALTFEDRGDYRQAAEAYRSALAMDPGDAILQFNFGNVLFALSEFAAAADAFRLATERDPAYVEAWNNYGSVSAELGRTDDAIAAFERAIRLVPSYADAHYNLADTLMTCGQESKARRHYRLYLQCGPDGPWAEKARRQLETIGLSS